MLARSSPSISTRSWSCGLPAFVVTLLMIAAAVASHGVDLVDEDDGRRVLLARFRKSFAHAREAPTPIVEFHELRAGDRQRRGPSPRRQRSLWPAGSYQIPGDRRAERRAGCARPPCGTCRGRPELANLRVFPRPVLTGDIREGDVLGRSWLNSLARGRETAHHPRTRHGAWRWSRTHHEGPTAGRSAGNITQSADWGRTAFHPFAGACSATVSRILRSNVKIRGADVLGPCSSSDRFAPVLDAG